MCLPISLYFWLDGLLYSRRYGLFRAGLVLRWGCGIVSRWGGLRFVCVLPIDIPRLASASPGKRADCDGPTGGCIHTFFEGYFSLNHARMGPSQSLFGQLWKEYALSDSRYLTSDSFVLWMETVTAFAWGPLSFALVYMISVKSPYRHITQVIVSLGQMYGLVLYFATSLFDDYWKGVTIGRPERYYFWFYYVFFNVIWFAIPGRELSFCWV